MRLSGALLLAFGAVSAGCSGREPPVQSETTALLADGFDLSGVEIEAQDVSTSVVGPDGASVSPDSVRFPRPCLVVEKTSPTSQVLHLRGCGVPALRGDLVVRWELRALAFHVEIEAHGFWVGATFLKDGLIAADVIATGTERTMIWRAHLAGVLRADVRPRTFAYDTLKTVRWTVGAPCVVVDASSKGSVDGRSVRVTLTGFRVCAGASCPEPRSHVRVENLVTRQLIDVRYAPNGHAVLRDVDGKLLAIRPACAG